jgi:hypothetical protein
MYYLGQEARMNHLEQLVSEWLQYNGYFVRTSVLVGPRPGGGHEGELDVVGIHMARDHLIHVECSLDADSREIREGRFTKKFERGRRHIEQVFEGLTLDPSKLDSVAILQFPNTGMTHLGGGRLLHTRDLIHEIFQGLSGKTPARGAVSSNFPLLRTLQLAADAQTVAVGANRLIGRAMPQELAR